MSSVGQQQLLGFLRKEWEHIISIPMFGELYGTDRKVPVDLSDVGNLIPITRELLASKPMQNRTSPSNGFRVLVSSSGTTGHPLVFPWTVKDETVAREVVHGVHKAVPWTEDDVVFVYAPMGLGSMWRHMQRQAEEANATVLLPGMVDIDTAIALIRDHEVSIIITLPSLAVRLGEAAAAERPVASIRQIACGGDVLSEQRRKRIGQLWQAECRNFFGMSELMGPMAGECLCGQYLQMDPHFAVEVGYKRTSRHGEGECIVSALWHRSAPIIRYRTGDLITITDEACPCGQSHGITVHGKLRQCPEYRGVRLLANELDDLVLSMPGSGIEWQLLLRDEYPELQIEGGLQEDHMVALRDAVSDYVGEAVCVTLHRGLMSQRAQPKPTRILQSDACDSRTMEGY